MHWFITATDTGVGKTYLTCLVLRALRAAGMTACGFKPVCTGGRDDARLLLESSSPGTALDEINPFWSEIEASPHIALRDGDRFDLPRVLQRFQNLRDRYDAVLVEGAGGWKTPVAPGLFIADLAREIGIPVVVVTANRLGAINHTLLTIESIRREKSQCAGVVLNNLPGAPESIATRTNRAEIEALTDVPLLFEISPEQEKLEFALA